ncbi:ArsR family transcriptional regulator [Haloterrigena sp. SYSU A558-1]|uniref:ArsR family transcriptional regulator n=1 Tax=Haloterrigena gelatinilytica TaxID=2741724 RepID=A0A8J8KC86_9EURY|nr:ArsR family transcriptional regulator [Haloterrigena gelatinilytica]NUB92170.1 ArsR family transcriptional regulator [Haloterrigena gelatinilytica]NUC72000.1 ArsR family transcriptional regulator [Haloterrigena gelatinilytica]
MLPVISDPESLTPVTGEPAGDGSQFDALADRRRRAVLRYLDDRDAESVSLPDLADHLVLEDDADDGGALASCGDALFGTRRRVAITLRHSHVPKLADVGAVAFDIDSNTVALTERGEQLLARADDIDAEPDAESEAERNANGAARGRAAGTSTS